MIVRGEFEERRDRPYLLLAVQVDGGFRAPVYIRFVVDTGCERTTIFPRDASRFGFTDDELDPATWPASVRTLGAGGTIASRLIRAMFSFEDDTDTFELESTIELAEAGPFSDQIPSLLGWDVLRYFRTTFNGLHPFTLELLQ